MGRRKALAQRRWAWVTGLAFVALFAMPFGASDAVEVGSGDDILIFVAHPDDDIITSAGVTSDHLTNGTGEITVAYVTNGDRCESQSQVDSGRCSSLQPGIGTIRQVEAVAAQEELGVVSGLDDDNLIFLGYPNGFVDKVRYNDTGSFPVLLNTATYASLGLGDTDWHDYRLGAGSQHVAYPSGTMSQGMLDDVEALIAAYKPDHIFTHSRWDRHEDHRSTYYTLIDAVQLVQDSDPSYDPYIHSTIVHVLDNGYWNAWPATADPTSFVNEYPELENDTGNELVWDQRESFEVPASMQNPYSSGNNPKAEAIEIHASQLDDGVGGFIRRFAHRDEIFWVEKLGAAEGRSDSYAVDQGNSLVVGGSGVLSNDVRGIGTPFGNAPGIDPAALGPMAAELVSGPDHEASFSLNADGSFSYTHDDSETSSDSFTYRPAQGSTDGSTTTVTIAINPVNDAPSAVADSYDATNGETLDVAADGVLGNDTDPEDDTLTAIKVSDPSHGALTLNSDGSFEYEHDGSAATSDSFTYKANDGEYDSNTVTVSLTIIDVTEDLVVDVAGPSTGATTTDYTFTAAVSGGAGSRSFAWRATLEGVFASGGSSPTFTFSDDDAGAYVIELTVTDGTGAVVDSKDFKLLGDIASSPFVGDIIWLADEGITKGCNPPINDQFCPNDRVTRGQMAAFLVRFLNLSAIDPDIEFDDIGGSVFETNILKLATAGITKGCNPAQGNTNFCPNDFVTRGQMAAFLVRAFSLTDDGGGNLFVDDDGSVFESNIDKLATAGITKGCNAAQGLYCPNGFVTRGQMAAFLHRADGL